ncbi:MAG: DUF1456 family protein [Pseudohongiellaceae bacterium]
MTNNDCLRRIRYILNLNDNEMCAVFSEAGESISQDQIQAWLRKDEDPAIEVCSDESFAHFLDGLINLKRGKKEDSNPQPIEELNNNIIFRKLKIAFNLQAEEILSLLALADFRLSKHELSAFFRRADHKHYRECKDQILRNFLVGLQLKYRERD